MLQRGKVEVQKASICMEPFMNQIGIRAVAYDSEGEGLQALLQGAPCLCRRMFHDVIQGKTAEHIWRQRPGYTAGGILTLFR
jgi:hypothetical protein